MRTGIGAGECDETPVRRSARQAGREPSPPQSPLPGQPPAEPTLSQMLLMMDERHRMSMTQIMREFGAHVQNNQAPPHQPGRSKLNDFQRTQPPKFTFASDPLEADDWLRTMEKKLELAHIDEADKVNFATHYLEGPANVWWDNLKEIRFEAGQVIPWTEFKDDFRKAHIPASLMKIKQQEFLALTQGHMTISEYLIKFNNLARYARDDANTEEKKKDRFLHGMHQALKTQLSVLQFPDFQAMVNTALIAEREHRHVFDSHKRKFDSSKPQFERNNNYNNRNRNWQPNHRTPAPAPAPAAPAAVQPAWTQPKRDDNSNKFYTRRPVQEDYKKTNACFKCGKQGHYIAQCPEGNGSNSSAIKPSLTARVHHMAAEEVHEMPRDEIGMCTVTFMITLNFIRTRSFHLLLPRVFHKAFLFVALFFWLIFG